MSKLLLIDGHSQAYRAFFGMKTPLTTSSGEPTGAVYGFARKLLSIIREYQPEYLAVAFDLGDTWRHAEFPEYKGTRERMPDEMQVQMGRIDQFLRAFNIPILTSPDNEADDVLGTLSRLAPQQQDGLEVLILTGDRDLFQLVNEQVKILYTSGGPNPKTSAYGPEEVAARYELTPQQFIDLKALTGDSSDNIPGVPGVGDKTAIKFLKQYETLDAVYENVQSIGGPKTRQNLVDAEAQVRLNKRLVTILTDLDLEFNLDACRLSDYDQDELIRFFQALEFRSLIKELPQSETATVPASALMADDETGQMALFAMADQPQKAAPVTSDYLTVQDEDALQQVADALSKASILSFDVETTSTDAVEAKLVGFGIAWAAGKAAYIPIAHQEGTQLAWARVKEVLQPYFADPTLPKLAHNAKYDLTICCQNGLEVAGLIHDTMIMAWLLDPVSHSLGLKAQAANELEWQMTELTELIGSGRKQTTIDYVDIEQVTAYCGADVDVALQLYDVLAPRVQEAGMWQLYEEIELPLIPVLTEMELAGIRLDSEILQEMSTQLVERLSALMTELYEIVGHEFNIRSTQQMSQVLFDEMAFPAKGIKKTRSGHYSTAVETLDRLSYNSSQLSADQQRLLEIIFEQRQLEKLRSTYVDNLPKLINARTGRLHTSFNQTGASTGRMSSSSPNLQNIPIRTEMGRKVRRAFVAAPGWLLMAADYSQVELRVLAHVAQEETLIKAFQEGLDIHAATAARLFDVPLAEVARDQRGLAKTINFATIYGSSAFGLSTRTDMTPKEAQRFMDQYFDTYPQIKAYIADTVVHVESEGYVETLLGRKRYFRELQNERLPYSRRQGVERAAINAPIQGAAADIMKIAMIRLHHQLKQGGYQARMLLQVHDEVVLELPPEEQEEVAALVCTVMESAYTLDVPLKVDVEAGLDWYNLVAI